MHSAVRWGKTIPELKETGLTDKSAADAKDPDNGNSAIHIAVQNGHSEIADWLVKELKCDVDAQNGSGNSALHMGAEYDYYLICKMLLEAGASKELKNGEGAEAIQGLSGTKVGPEAWDNPVTIMKTVADDVDALDELFKKLEQAKPEDIKKDELVKTGMTKKKELKAWAAGGFQARFTDIVRKL
jgi:hypothetical protein